MYVNFASKSAKGTVPARALRLITFTLRVTQKALQLPEFCSSFSSSLYEGVLRIVTKDACDQQQTIFIGHIENVCVKNAP